MLETRQNTYYRDEEVENTEIVRRYALLAPFESA